MLHHWSGGRGRTRRPSGPRPFLRHRSHLRCGRAQARHQKAAGRPHQPLCRGRRSAEGQALMSEAVIPPAPKVDPETLAIRTKPARAIRFRRSVIIAITALGSVSLMAVAWIALKPRVFSAVADRQLLSEPSNRPSADALNGLPATYGDAPKLGPPLQIGRKGVV